MAVTSGAKRGCGFRMAGGIYACTPLGTRGHAVECFLFDPPRPVEAAVLGLSARGVSLFADSQGVTHVLDWIGEDNYPNVADFIEETRRLGLSRRLPRTVDFAKLTVASRLFVVHRRAWIDNPTDYYRALGLPLGGMHTCPGYAAYQHCQRGTCEGPHAVDVMDPTTGCGRLWWHDLTGGDPVDDAVKVGMDYERICGDTRYVGQARPEGVSPRYGLAIFGAFPIRQLEVVKDIEGGTHEESLSRTGTTGLPVTLVDE